MRYAAVVVLVGIALGGAAYLGTQPLNSHGDFPACTGEKGRPVNAPCAPASSAVWQLPAAVFIASLGVVAAIGAVKRR